MSQFSQMLLDVHEKLIIDLFAGGGGASVAIELATGRQVDVAINHDAAAVALHQANHPQTEHYVSDVFEVDPRQVTKGRRVGLLWASPDCTYFSKSRGGKPIRSKLRKRRALAWVVTRWAGQVEPDVIILENVEEFADWGPLVGPPDGLLPCRRRRGRTFRRFVRSLENRGYEVEWRELRACDYGAPTIRKRLFVIARRDGQKIVWPAPTHGDPSRPGFKGSGLKPWRTAAECIDWSIPMCSIFATREEAKQWAKFHGQASPIRPLVENTNKRIARGVMRYVVNNPKPYTVPLDAKAIGLVFGGHFEQPSGSVLAPIAVTAAHGEVSPSGAKRRGAGARSLEGPHSTIPCSNDTAVVAPLMVQSNHGDKPYSDVEEPVRTIVAGGTHHAVVAPVISTVTRQGERRSPPTDEPLPTITSAHRGEHSVVAPFLVPRYGERDGQEPRSRSADEPIPVIVPSGNGAGLVAANLSTYYGDQEGATRAEDLDAPLATQTTENRHAVVASFLTKNHGGFAEGNGDGCELQTPLGTVLSCGQGHHGLLAAHMTHANTGHTPNSAADEPIHTVVADGARHSVVAAHVQRDFGQSVGSSAAEPLGTVTPGGMGKAAVVAAFLSSYYGTGVGHKVDEPAHTIPTVDRFGLVIVRIGGVEYVIEDIAMRMLQPHELYLAQGFPPSYVIDRGADGRILTKTEQVRMVGNSVSPPVACALVRANCADLIARKELIA